METREMDLEDGVDSESERSEEIIQGEEDDSLVISSSIEDLQRRCEFLLGELKAFADHLRSLGRENSVELRGPYGAIEAELKGLNKLAKNNGSEVVQARSRHILRSSNIPYHEAVWATAKNCTGVVAFSKRFYWHPHQRAPIRRAARTKHKHSALVDIVARDGAEWIKVSTITETRLLFELAKQGWEAADLSSGSEEDDERSPASRAPAAAAAAAADDDEDDRVSILRMAEGIAKAAQATRVRYQHPRVRFVLPKITPGRLPEIDTLLSAIRATGATVETSTPINVTTPPLPAALATMTVDVFAAFSATLNIDCTILLALVSDLSHAHIERKPWFHRATTRQIEMEEKEALLPSSLYPAMGARALVCTPEAARRMREIVDTIGTASEKARTALLMGDGGGGQAELVRRFGELSDYPVPSAWQLPIRVVEEEGEPGEGAAGLQGLPALAGAVAARLSDINRSVFLYGWRAGLTTVTSNRTVARMIEETIEASRGEGEEDVVGPALWLCPMARSLVGKEKGRKPE